MNQKIRRMAWLGVLALSLLGTTGCGSSTSSKSTNTAASAGSAVVIGEDGTVKRAAVNEGALNTFQEAVKASRSNPAQAIQLYEQAAKQEANFAEAWYNAGLLYQQQGNNSEAKKAYEKAISMRPDMADAYNNIGRMQLEAGDLDAAEKTFLKVVGEENPIDPLNVAANLNLGMIYRHKGEEVLAIHSGGVEKQFSMSGNDNKEELEDKEANAFFNKAVGHIRRALAGDSNNIYCYENLSAIYYLMNSLEVARLVITQAKLKFDEYNGSLQESLEAGRITQEEFDLKAYQPKDLAVIYNTSGLIYLAEGEVSLGNAEFKQAVNLDPDSVSALLNVAGIAVNVQDYQLAFSSYEHVLSIQPNNTEAYLSKGVALRGLNRLDEAEAIYRDIIKNHPEYPQAQFNLNVLYQEYYLKIDESRQMWVDFTNNPKAQEIIPGRVEEAKLRIKQIDDLKEAQRKAEEDAAKMQAAMEEMERMQREMEEAEKAAAGN